MSMLTRADWEPARCDECWREDRVNIPSERTLKDERLCDECWKRAAKCNWCGTREISTGDSMCGDCKNIEDEEKSQSAIFLLDNSSI